MITSTTELMWRRVENDVNAAERHCRIGKVTIKRIPQPDPVAPIWPAPERNWWDDPYRPVWSPILGSANRKCSCLPGTACGNAACPHMPIITSSNPYMMAAH